jgi:formyl-CoA transferase
MSNLLAGVRVIESAMLLNGSTVGTMLGDLGADVIKVENPRAGDYVRDMAGQIAPHNSPLHIQVNKHKRSIAVNLRTDGGRDVFWRLLDTADVFIDGNVDGSMSRLGLGYEEQRTRRPGLVFCHYSGFGADGPYSSMPTHGWMMSALAGATPMLPGTDGLLHRVPVRNVSSSQHRDSRSGGEATSAGAVHAAMHVVAALFARERTGAGAYIDVAGVDGVLAHAWVASTISMNEHRITERRDLAPAEQEESHWAKYNYYEAADGKVVLFGAIERKFWQNFCRAADRPDLADRHDDSESPVDYATDSGLRHLLADLFRTRAADEWVELALKYDFPCSPAPRSIVEASADVHVAGRGVFVDAPDPVGGVFTYVGEAGRVAGQPYAIQRPAPRLGEHSLALLSEIGFDQAAIEHLVASGIVVGDADQNPSG